MAVVLSIFCGSSLIDHAGANDMVTRFSFPPYALYWERFGGISSASFLDISSPPNIHSSPPPEIATRDAPGNIQPFVPRASYACDESGVSRIMCELAGAQIIWIITSRPKRLLLSHRIRSPLYEPSISKPCPNTH